MKSLKTHNYPMLNDIEKFVQHLIAKIKAREGGLPPRIKLLAPKDALSQYVEEGCELAGIFLYYDLYNTFAIDYRLYDLLSDRDKAALIVHESVYFFLRKAFKVENSIAARAHTSCAFSKSSCEGFGPVKKVERAELSYACSDDLDYESRQSVAFRVNLLPEQDVWRFHSTLFRGVALPTVSYFDVPSSDLIFEYVGEFGENLYRINYLNAATTFYTRSSQSIWTDISVKLPIELGRAGLQSSRMEHAAINCRLLE